MIELLIVVLFAIICLVIGIRMHNFFRDRQLRQTEDGLRQLYPFDFQKWAIQKLGGRLSSRMTSDKGVDGYFYDGGLLGRKRYAVQIKRSNRVGRNTVDNFETAMRRAGQTKGAIVAFSFTSGAYEEVARAKKQDGLEIRLLRVRDLLASGQFGIASYESTLSLCCRYCGSMIDRADDFCESCGRALKQTGRMIGSRALRR